MSTVRPIGLRLFDATPASVRRASNPSRPLDNLRALSQALLQTDPRLQSGRIAALPDFVSAVTASVSAARGAGTDPASGAFTLTRAAPAETVRVTSLASAGHARSAGFASASDEVTAGTLGLTVGGKSYSVTIAQGATLKDVVAGIRASGAAVDATIDNDGGQLRLGLTARASGFDASGTADDALSVTETDSGATGTALGLAVDHRATNAIFALHGVGLTSRNNLITDDVTGATIDLANPTGSVGQGTSRQVSSSLLARGVVGGGVEGALVSVDSLAQAAEVRSSRYESDGGAVKAGTLSLNVDGRQFDVAIKDGDTLADVRRNVENSGANVKAALVKDGGGVRLAITARDTGYAPKGRPEDALTVTETSTGSGGQALEPSVTQAARNARVTVNGSVIESRGNSITNAIPGFTLNAQRISSSPEVVPLAGGVGGLRAPLNVENELNRVLQAQLLKPRDLGLADDSKGSGTDDVKQLAGAAKSTPSRPPAGGNESSRRDILKKLTAVDDIFGGLKAAQALLASASAGSTAPAGAAGSTSASAA